MGVCGGGLPRVRPQNLTLGYARDRDAIKTNVYNIIIYHLLLSTLVKSGRTQPAAASVRGSSGPFA